jgi:hypothetical protein
MPALVFRRVINEDDDEDETEIETFESGIFLPRFKNKKGTNLDFAGGRIKNWPMNFHAENLYAVWRARQRAPVLCEENSLPPEKLLQTVWQHQRLIRHDLQTADGRRLRILHPGFISAEGGPDFRGAVLQFDNDKPVAGDVEIDLQSNGWHAHGHDENPAFQNVILHVIWNEVQSPKLKAQSRFAVLALKNVLDAPLPELALALENESGLPENLRGQCAAPLRGLSDSQLTELLHAAAKVRFKNKAAAMLASARNSGWEQVLWENLFRALGYKQNLWPMLNLAETRPRWTRGANSTFELQSRLLGVSGLLPVELTRAQKSSDTFLRHAWDVWWRDRDELETCTLPRAVWKFHGLRPANHPQRRLALASHWLATENLIAKIEAWGAQDFWEGRRAAVPEFVNALHGIFQVTHDEFWSWHWTFKSARMAKPQPLLGVARVTDLAVNVILPWLWIRGACARPSVNNENFQREIERRFFAWPAAEDNSVLKLARQRLLGGSRAKILSGAAAQQGLMQVVRDFCEHSNVLCDNCRFPELVRGFQISGK